MASVLVAIAVFAPLFSSAVAAVARPGGLGAGRVVAVGCGVGAIAAIGVLIASGRRADGIVGDVGLFDLQVDRPSAPAARRRRGHGGRGGVVRSAQSRPRPTCVPVLRRCSGSS